jgi:hypothetical protein
MDALRMDEEVNRINTIELGELKSLMGKTEVTLKDGYAPDG